MTYAITVPGPIEIHNKRQPKLKLERFKAEVVNIRVHSVCPTFNFKNKMLSSPLVGVSDNLIETDWLNGRRNE